VDIARKKNVPMSASATIKDRLRKAHIVVKFITKIFYVNKKRIDRMEKELGELFETEDIEIKDMARENKRKKAKLSLVPSSVLYAIAKVLNYGNQKYKVENSWKHGDIKHYRDAMYRHWLAYIDNPSGLDESGCTHLEHVAANVAILVELEKRDKKYEEKQ